MFDMIRYAVENEVSIEVYPSRGVDGFVIRLRDMKNAATESSVVRWHELQGIARKDLFIEDRCDRLLTSMGKRKAVQKQREAEQAHRNAIEDFFRSPGNGIMVQ